MVLKRVTIMLLSFVSLAIMAQKKENTTTIKDTTQKTITIKGIVSKGVEAGCIILTTREQKVYLLLNLKTEIKEGSCIKATGYVQKNKATTCMQGIPFYTINYCPCSKKSKPKYQRDLPKEKTMKTN
ncbi:MAG: hypothetical protein KatS3mg027_1395 [Bacteroidia bacterium]|nr:MAG: hypothetical protein KatS3mg027_1395 [Bacteroidia bacterium]